MSRTSAVTYQILFTLSLLTSCSLLAQLPSTVPRHDSQFEVFGSYWTSEPGWRTTLELRNNLAARDLTVQPALRTADGREILLPQVSIKPDEVKNLEVEQALKGLAPELQQRAGSFGSVVFRYTSRSAQNLYANVMIFRTGYPIAYHFDTFGTADSFQTGTLEGIWWLPKITTTAFLVLSNEVSHPVQLELSLSAGTAASHVQKFTIGPRQNFVSPFAIWLVRPG